METPFRPGLFAGEVAVVTGGGTGIGLATGLELARLGAKLVIAGRRPDKLESAAAQLRAAGAECLAQPCDIRELEQVTALVDAALARFGRIDLLVNNAGGQFPTSAESLKPKGWDAVIRNNLSGTWYLTQAVGTKAMIPQRGGRIVNVIANIARGFPGMVHTGAARAGVENLTRTLAIEWAQYGIKVVAVAPGVILSSGTEQYPPELIEAGRRRTPLKRYGTVEEVAHSIVFVGSREAADFITGITLYIDGGASLWGDSWPIPDRQ